MERAIPHLPADDPGVAKAFYVDRLGFRVLFEGSDDGKTGILGLARGTIRLTIDSAMEGYGRNVCVSLEVDDTDAYFEEWSANVDVLRSPKNEAWGARTFDLLDPFGNTLFVIGPMTERSARRYRDTGNLESYVRSAPRGAPHFVLPRPGVLMVQRAARTGAQRFTGVRRGLHAVWHRRRWIYGAWVLLAVTRIPARTGFRLVSPACDMSLTLGNLALSLAKVPHIVLFGGFFLVTLIQFDGVDRKSVAWSVAATAVFSVVIEIEQGATRTGNCRITDVAPNLLGALLAAILVAVVATLRNRIGAHPSSGTRH